METYEGYTIELIRGMIGRTDSLAIATKDSKQITSDLSLTPKAAMEDIRAKIDLAILSAKINEIRS